MLLFGQSHESANEPKFSELSPRMRNDSIRSERLLPAACNSVQNSVNKW